MPNHSSDESPVVLITGAAGGLGIALVRAFADAGCRVGAGEHRRRIHTPAPQVMPVTLDVTRSESVEQAVQCIQSHWGRIDVLVNNAGRTADGVMARLSAADWDAVMAVNLKGVFRVTRAAGHGMLRRRSGHIINIASFAAKNGHAGQSNYVAAKAGLVGLTLSLAREMGRRNVQVNAIFPGVLDTPMTAGLADAQRKQLAASNVLGRTTTVDEVAAFIVHLSGMRHVSGQVFQLDSRIGTWT